jgi:hypothetical protein
MDRGDIISEAWSIMRSNRSLWGIAVLVLIVSLITGVLISLADSPLLSVAGAALGLLLTAFLSGALISMVNAVADNRPLSASAGVKAGFQWTIPLFIIRLILAVPVWVIAFVLGGSLAMALVSEGSSSIAIILQSLARSDVTWVLILLVSILFNALGIGAERGVVLRQHSVVEALKHGWRLLWAHLGDYVVLGLLLLAVSIGIGLLFACSVMVTSFLFTTSRSSDYYSSSVTQASIIVMFISAAANIVITIFQSAAWTLAFREWQAQEHNELPVAIEQI